MQFRIRVPIIFGLLIAYWPSSATAQINTGYFPHHVPLPIVEPCYDPRPIIGCYRDIGPCWLGQTSFDVLLLDRSNADSRSIANRITTVDLGPPRGVVRFLGAEVANTDDLGFPVTAGFRFNLVLPGEDNCDLVFNYLGSRFDVSQNFSGAATGFSYFEFGTGPEDGSMYQASYESTLTSVELNTRVRGWERIAPMTGVRFIQLNDDFSYLAADGSSYLDSTVADNDLWGFQLGAEALLWDGGPLRLQTTVKAGVFYNNVGLNTNGGDIVLTRDPVTMAATSTYTPSASFSSGRISSFGEVNLELAYRIGPHWALRAGYAAMWLDGVALAPDQFDYFNLQSNFGTFNYGTVLYHGSYIGIEGTW